MAKAATMKKLLIILVSLCMTSNAFAQTAAGQYKRVGSQFYVSRELGATGKFVWDILDVNEIAPGGAIRLSADGTETVYHPDTPTAQDNFAALRTAMAALVDGDELFADPKALYEYGGGAVLTVDAVNDVTIHGFRATRDAATTYTRILTISDSSDVTVEGFSFNGRAEITYESSYPFNAANGAAITVTNPNEVAGSPTYVIYVSNSDRVAIKNCQIKQHAGTRQTTASGFPIMASTYGIQVASTSDDCHISDCKFDYCGYSGVSSGGPGTIISNCQFDMSGWHSVRWDGGAGTRLLVKGCTFSESVPRLMGYRSGFDGNSGVLCDQVVLKDCTFRHEDDWFPDLVAYSAGETITLPTDDRYRYNSGEIYERLTTGAGNIPAGKTSNVDWKWLMPYTSTWQAKFGNCNTAIVDNCRMVHGKNGDAIGIRASVKVEDTVKELRIQNHSFLSGQLLGVSSMAYDTDVYVTDSTINATAEGVYGSRIDRCGMATLINSTINYDRRAWFVPGEDDGPEKHSFQKGFYASNCKFIPWKVNYTNSEIIQNADVAAIVDNIHYDKSNRIVDRDTGTEYLTGFSTDHKLADTDDLRLWLSGSADEKIWDGTLAGNFAHPTETAGGSLSVDAAYATQNVRVKNGNWSGLGEVVSWSYDGSTLWQPAIAKYRHVTTGSADGTPDVTFATSCQTPGDGTTITDFDWSVTIPTGWIMNVSIGSTDTIDAGTGTIDFGTFGTGPADPWTPAGGGHITLRYDGTTWIRLFHQ